MKKPDEYEEYLQVTQEMGLAAGEFLVEELQNAPLFGERGKEVAAIVAALGVLINAIPEPEEERTEIANRFKKAIDAYTVWAEENLQK